MKNEELERIVEIKPCPYVNGFSSENTGVNFVLQKYEFYSDFILFESGEPSRCFRFNTRQEAAKVPEQASNGIMLRTIIANDVLIKNMRHRDARWHDDPDVAKVLEANTAIIKEAGEATNVSSGDDVEKREFSKAAHDVIAERQRQISDEGWSPLHDDQYDAGELINAACSYALQLDHENPRYWLSFWPWNKDWFKPKNRRRDLIKATALLLAEIERVDRKADQLLAKPPTDKGE